MFKKFQFIVSLVLFLSLGIFAQNLKTAKDINPNLGPFVKSSQLSVEAMWDVQLEFNALTLSGAAGNAGAEYDGTSFYSTRWASNLIHEYSGDGTALVREFSIPGVTGLRDLAYDGQYFYGGASANTIYQMDFTTNTLVGTIASPVAVRHIAYDSDNDAFWVGNWATDIYLVGRDGSTLAQIPAATHTGTGVYGSCYDNVSPGGPYLWIFDQGSVVGAPQLIRQLQLPGGTPTGVQHNVYEDVALDNPTGSAGGLFSTTDFATGIFSIGGLMQSGDGIAPEEIFLYEVASAGPPCPIDPPSNPSPVSGTTDVSITGNTANWTNGAGATAIEVWFGPVGNLAMVYDGTPVTSLSLAAVEPLDYFTTYGWRVIGKNDTCSIAGPVWTFTTEQDPNLVVLFFDDFEAGSGLWNILNNGGTCVWTVYTPPFPNLYTLPCDPACGSVLSADSDECGSGSTINSSAVIASPLDISLYSQVDLEFDQDFNDFGGPDEGYVEVSNDGGTTWNIVWQQIGADLRNTHEVVDISAFAALQSSVLIRFRSVQPAWDWWWTIDNVKVIGSGVVPVELTSFAATTDNRNVTLNWSTATELNNSGFQVERSSGSAYEVVGFVAGSGTTTEIRNYNFVDQNVASGTYSYRLKQVDFDGTFEYSNAIEVEVVGVKEFTLGQNYPNPFNPSTTINFSLAVDSKVSLKIFDVLGQEVATLINGQMAAGSQKVSFDASSLNSGVYFYRIDASGIDGQKFSSVKKMILTK